MIISPRDVYRATIEHLQSLFLEHGSDAWWTLPMDQLLPKRVKEKVGCFYQFRFKFFIASTISATHVRERVGCFLQFEIHGPYCIQQLSPAGGAI